MGVAAEDQETVAQDDHGVQVPGMAATQQHQPANKHHVSSLSQNHPAPDTHPVSLFASHTVYHHFSSFLTLSHPLSPFLILSKAVAHVLIILLTILAVPATKADLFTPQMHKCSLGSLNV